MKFSMVMTPEESIRERIKDWYRDHPGATAKEVCVAFNLGYPGVRRHVSIIKKEWRRDLRDRKRATSVKIPVSKPESK